MDHKINSEELYRNVCNMQPGENERLVVIDSNFDVMKSDLEHFCKVKIDDTSIISSFYTRDLCKGSIILSDSVFEAVFFVFHSGNASLLAYIEEGSALSNTIAECRKKRRLPMTLRTLFKDIYFISGIPLGFCVLFLIIKGMFLRALAGFAIMYVIRRLYVVTRNKL